MAMARSRRAATPQDHDSQDEAQVVVEEERGEEEPEIRDGVAERAHRPVRTGARLERNGIAEKYQTEWHAGSEIQKTRHAGQVREERDQKQQHRIKKHMQARVLDAIDDRQHRNTELGIV